MLLIEIILLGIALSIDAFIVSFSQGLIIKQNKTSNAFKIAISMAIFHIIMPLIGWYGSDIVSEYICEYAKWLSFTIFVVLGVKVIIESFDEIEDDGCDCKCPGISLKCLLSLCVATSIDALAAGVSIYFLNEKIWFITAVISIFTLINSLIGFLSGQYCKKIPSKWLEIVAGIILILIGIKALLV